MATKAKRWPTNAEWARLDAIVAARKIADQLRPIIEGANISEVEVVLRVARAQTAALEIENKLNTVGPKVM